MGDKTPLATQPPTQIPFHISHYANDGHIRFAAFVPYALADRVFSREEATRQRFVDDNDRWCVLSIQLSETMSRTELHLHSSKVIRTDSVFFGHWCFLFIGGQVGRPPAVNRGLPVIPVSIKAASDCLPLLVRQAKLWRRVEQLLVETLRCAESNGYLTGLIATSMVSKFSGL